MCFIGKKVIIQLLRMFTFTSIHFLELVMQRKLYF